MNWTNRQETEYLATKKRLELLEDGRDRARQEVVDAFQGVLAVDKYECTGVDIDKIIAIADRIRDVLAPFDSGVRNGVKE